MDIGRISGQAVFSDGVRPAEITFDEESGMITAVEHAAADLPEDILVFPGFIDIHVHAREYALPQDADSTARGKWEAACRKETFSTAGQAAINGGVTLFAAMPNDPIPPSDEDTYKKKQSIASGSPCPVIVYAAITPESAPWADLPYKVYLDRVPSSMNFTDWRELQAALNRYAGCRVFFHAEDPEILNRSAGEGPRWRTRPPDAEIRAVEKILEMTAKLGIRTHICHVSTEKAVRLIQEYNASSANRVTCEVTPHHLFFSVEEDRVICPERDAIPFASLLESNPPLRSEADRRFLVEALRDGLVQVLASDHAPHTIEDKQNGAPGMPHLDTLGAFAGWLMNRCGFLPVRVAEVMSAAPARIFAKDLALGHVSIEPGAAAALTVLDLRGSTAVGDGAIEGRGPLKTRCGWSPFEGLELSAAVKTTVVGGKVYEFYGAAGNTSVSSTVGESSRDAVLTRHSRGSGNPESNHPGQLRPGSPLSRGRRDLE